MIRKLLTGCAFALAMTAGALAQTQLRMTWYSDGNEGEVITELVKRFESKNPDIKVTIDQVPFKAINETRKLTGFRMVSPAYREEEKE